MISALLLLSCACGFRVPSSNDETGMLHVQRQSADLPEPGALDAATAARKVAKFSTGTIGLLQSGSNVRRGHPAGNAENLLHLQRSLQASNHTDELVLNQAVQAVEREAQTVKAKLTACGHPLVGEMFHRAYTCTMDTTVSLTKNLSTYVITGDISDEWLRDSSAQLNPYIHLTGADPNMRILIEGAIRLQMYFLHSSPYANAFHLESRVPTAADKRLGRGGHVATFNYEVDSYAYFLRFCYQYWLQSSRTTSVFDADWFHTVDMVVEIAVREQHHEQNSPYRYVELPRHGLGSPVNYTGMTWTGYRPSDDACKYHYLVPANAFLFVALGNAKEMIRALATSLTVPSEKIEGLQGRIDRLRSDIDEGIHTYGVVSHPKYGQIYAYEVDGLGNYTLMDDANAPSLLSLQYFNYTSPRDPGGVILRNTRRFVLSKDNPYYYSGRAITGVGSPHTPAFSVWPMSVILQGMTAEDSAEALDLLKMVIWSDSNSGYMHESVDHDRQERFTRPWFAWANALLAEFILQRLPDICQSPPWGDEKDKVHSLQEEEAFAQPGHIHGR
mmetsp:Transcript_26310/g.60995  ORF Transcript_26310/g.60995 Transcript_26310/m.60995 type:complete len:558 (+) Transcript_26310:48-1721(+)